MTTAELRRLQIAIWGPQPPVAVKQQGPLRQHEQQAPCESPGCGSPTFFKVNGSPRCMIHALRELNAMLCGLDVE